MKLAIVERCAPARFVRIGRGALERGERVLLVAELTGDAILLGRHQRARSAVDPLGRPLLRRLGGGRALAVGEGTAGVLVVERPSFPAEKTLNRLVRGLMAALRSLHLRPFYPGRDFVSVDQRQVASVSQDGTPGGAVAFEAYLALTRPLALPPGVNRYPAHRDPRAGGPPHSTVAEISSAPCTFGSVAGAIAAGYGALGDATALAEDDEPDPAVLEEERGFAWSGVADVPIGFVEALVRKEGDRLLEARLRGDFIAPAFILRTCERALAGCPIAPRELADCVNEGLGAPGAAVHGVKDSSIFVEALLAALHSSPMDA